MLSRLSNMFRGNDMQHSSAKSNTMEHSCTKLDEDSMMFDQQCEQYQIDNSESILGKIANLYAERLMSDIVLVVGEREFPAHRLILCASSEVFQVMLMKPQWTESKEQRIILQEAPECVEVFEMFLKYLYTGQLKVSHATVLPTLGLADKYNVKDLISICCGYMKNHIVSAVRQNFLISWLQYTLACGHSDIANDCMNHLKWNFEQVAKSEEFSSCDVGLLTTILSQHDLVVYDEMMLYNNVVTWLQHQEDLLLNTPTSIQGEPEPEPQTFFPSQSTLASGRPLSSQMYLTQPSLNPSRKKYYFRQESANGSSDQIDQMEHLTYEVMRFVRFPMMTPRQLADLLLVPLTIKYKEFFVTRMAIGMSFHSGQWDRILDILSKPDVANQLLFTPRLYTVEKWSASLTVDNLPHLPAYHTRTLFFSTPVSASEMESDTQLEWIVELCPKGVWFRKFFLIIWNGTFEVPEAVLRTCRLAITAKDPEYARVRIAVLVCGIQDGIEHIRNVVTTKHIFTSDDNLLNMDNILPFDELNDPVKGLKYLLDPCDSLKIVVVISPLTDPKFQARNS